MPKRFFWIFCALILIFAFIIRLMPTQNNNFFFTTDQGEDAVNAREFWWRGQILTKGPETSIPGIFAGPGWYYFISIGYKLFNGHPFGGVFILIMLSLATTAVVIWQLSKRVSLNMALLTGAALQIFWPFYETSRYAFNPFPLVFLAFTEILLLCSFLAGQKKYFYWATLPIILAFNLDLAGAAALFIFYLAVGLWSVVKGKLAKREFAIFTLVPVIFLLEIGRQFLTVGFKSIGSSNVGIFSGTSFAATLINFVNILKQSVTPQSLFASLIIVIGVAIKFLLAERNGFKRNFVMLVLTLLGISYLFFATNKGWRDWHTIYLAPLLFISLILMVTSFSKKLAVVILTIVFLSQLTFFQNRYQGDLQISDNPSLLVNQLKALDWIYENREGDGFNNYNFLADSDKDYPYQYLFWWYGRSKYGFVPCEYQNFPYPITSKYTYVPGAEFYSEPHLGCDKFRFLIIEDNNDVQRQEKWFAKVTAKTKLLEETKIGKIKIEKRLQIEKIN
ncbi:hypothetical protein HY404_03910 [Candidatus Microgenomates bacterium]|nr:hypothetical protein [Candidatus Microgenomates bacterium]